MSELLARSGRAFVELGPISMVENLDLVNGIAAELKLPADLLAAQIRVESSWQEDAFRFEQDFYRRYIKGNPNAKAGAYGPLAACSFGLLQIVLEVALELGFNGQPWELFDPCVGLLWGAKKLRAIWDKYPAAPYQQVLAIYNGGETGNLAPPYRNQAYVNRVMPA